MQKLDSSINSDKANYNQLYNFYDKLYLNHFFDKVAIKKVIDKSNFSSKLDLPIKYFIKKMYQPG